MLQGVKLARKIAAAPALVCFARREICPGPQATDDQTLREHISKFAQSFYHLVGTCKMGADNLAVVDSELRVHGVEGLGVVDAFVMPTITAGSQGWSKDGFFFDCTFGNSFHVKVCGRLTTFPYAQYQETYAIQAAPLAQFWARRP